MSVLPPPRTAGAEFGRMRGKSMFGEQALSSRPSAPGYGFGSSTRAGQAKVHMGGLAAKVPTGTDTPGPRYTLPTPRGRRCGFGTAERFGVPDRFSDTPRTAASPGPAAYGNSSSMGKQTYSAHSSSPRRARKYGFGTSDRAMAAKVFISPMHSETGNFGMGSPGPAFINNDRSSMTGSRYGFGTDGRFTREQRQLSDSADSPGPGTYGLGDGPSVQFSSSRSASPREPTYRFGTCTREGNAKVFVSNEHSKGGAFVYSPGPASYKCNSSIGSQATTRGRTSSSWGFSKADRFRDNYETGTPGPGAYAI